MFLLPVYIFIHMYSALQRLAEEFVFPVLTQVGLVVFCELALQQVT